LLLEHVSLGQISAIKPTVAPAPVDVAALVADELEQLRVAHGTRRLELDVTGDTGALCDGRRIQQMLDCADPR